MGNHFGSNWLKALPWTLLGRRTAYQADLDTSPAEVVFRSMPRLPGDLVEKSDKLPVADLLEHLCLHAAKPSTPTSHHQDVPVNFSPAAKAATHVFARKGKSSPLGPIYEGPFQIEERIGNSCLRVRVGTWANGQPRHELQFWNNCFPASGTPTVEASKVLPGCKMNPNATPFAPQLESDKEMDNH